MVLQGSAVVVGRWDAIDAVVSREGGVKQRDQLSRHLMYRPASRRVQDAALTGKRREKRRGRRLRVPLPVAD